MTLLNCVANVLNVIWAIAALVFAVSALNKVMPILWRWLISDPKECSATRCPMCGQSVSGVTGSSSTNTGHQD